MTTACSGLSYSQRADGGVLVSGELVRYPPGSETALLEQIWQQYGSSMRKAAKKYGVPEAQIGAVIAVESRGNPKACSPCDPKICSFAPACGGPCCAYGLMQMIQMVAKEYGVANAEQLLGNPELAIDRGTALLAKLSRTYGGDFVKMASAYNAGSHKCRGFGLFGNAAVSQGDYSGKAVRYANTAIALGLGRQTSLAGAFVGGAVLSTLVVGGYLWWTGELRVPKLSSALGR